MKIAGSIILYNPELNVLDNIDSYIYEIDKLYIFDNSSSNNNFIDAIKKKDYFNKIVYYTENKNFGVAKALNYCCNEALKDGYDWILTMDQDSFFEKESILRMIKQIDNNYGIIAPKYDIDNFYNCDNLVVMTSGNLVNLKIWKELNGFMEYLFIDMIDYEYCLKLRNNNYDIKIIDDALLKHKLGDIKYAKILNKKIYYTNHLPIRRYYITRNRLIINYLYRKKFPEFLSKELRNNRRELIKVVLFEKNKFDKIKMYIKAKKDYRKWRSSYEKNKL